MSILKNITRNPQRINRSMEFPEDAMTPPMGKSPIDAMQDHLNFNSFLANERDAGNISGEEYNLLGGYDVSQTMSPGNPIGGMALNLGGGTVYNTLQGLFDTEGQPRELVATPNEDGTISYTSLPTSSQKFGDIPGTVARNTLGASGLISNDLKQTYEDLRAKFENREPQNITNFNLVDAAGNLKDRIGNLFFTPAYAPEVTDKERQSIELEDDLMNYNEFYDMPEEKKREGILSKLNPMKALGFLANVATGGLSNALTTTGLGTLFSKIAEAARNTPNYQFANPNKPGFNRIASDFYDPRTGLDRFDRAKTLFGQSRTLKEYLDKKKAERIAKQQQEFLNNQNRGGDGPQNNPQGGLGRQDYSRASNQAFQDLADELGIK